MRLSATTEHRSPFWKCLRLLAVAPSILLLLVSVLIAQPQGPTEPIILEHADNFRGQTISTQSDVIHATGDVRLRQGLIYIEADRAEYYAAGDRAHLFGNVKITRPGVVMTAPEVDYNGQSGMAVAPRGVVIREDSGTLTSGHGRYDMNRRISYFRDSVRLTDSNTTVTAQGGEYHSIDRRAIFEGNVVALSDSGRLTSNSLTYWRGSQESNAVGDVRLESYQDSTILVCDSLRNRPGVETFAVGHVLLTAERDRTTLSGDSLRHLPDQDYTIVTGAPVLTQIDSTLEPYRPPAPDSLAAVDPDSIPLRGSSIAQLDTVRQGDSVMTIRRDTTRITALKLERFTKGRKEFRATGNAHMQRGTLEAAATLARFFEDDEIIALGPALPSDKPTTGDAPDGTEDSMSDIDSSDAGPAVDEEDSSVASDDDDVVDGSDEEQESDPVNPEYDDEQIGEENESDVQDSVDTAVETFPVVWYDESQLTGDTITVFMKEKKLELIDVVGNAFAITRNDYPGRFDQLASNRLQFNVNDGEIRRVRAEGSAASIYFIYEGALPNGLNRSSGDTIVILFAEGKASHVGIYGPRSRLEGEVVPENTVAGQEVTYRLSGFDWRDRISAAGSDNEQTQESESSEIEDEGEAESSDEDQHSDSVPENEEESGRGALPSEESEMESPE